MVEVVQQLYDRANKKLYIVYSSNTSTLTLQKLKETGNRCRLGMHLDFILIIETRIAKFAHRLPEIAL